MKKSRWFVIVAIWACLASKASGAENYAVEFKGAPPAIKTKLNLVSNLALETRLYPTLAAIRRTGRSDTEAIEQALSAAGYYAGKADVSFAPDSKESGKTLVTFVIEPGPLFEIVDHRLVYADETDAPPPQTITEAGVKLSTKADGATLQKNQQAILAALWNQGFPAARAIDRRAEANMETGIATAIYIFESGPRARFGGIAVTGNKHVKTTFLEKLKSWEDGAQFERAKIVTYRNRIAKTGVFQSLEVEPGAVDEAGNVPILVTVSERKQRTFGVGASYSTAEGPGARLFFEYRNLFGAGETARTLIEGTEIQQGIRFNLDKPLPLLPGVAFSDFGFTNETTDAFNARTYEVSGGFSKRWLDDRLETRAGLGFETSRIRENGASERTNLAALPLSVVWSTEADPLVLSKGTKVSLAVTPYSGSDTFTQTEFTTRGRINVGRSNRFTLAGRARLAATVGSSLNGLPLNKRYFSGGGGSVRGYDFQAVGPLDAQGDPIGGRSVIEGSVEARVRIAKKFQIAGFVDTGAVSESQFPQFDADYLTGAGGGARYLTPIGPIRVDIAVPLEKRANDRAIQVYISLGQPF